MDKKTFLAVVANWTKEERIKAAQERVRILTDRVQYVIELHAANEIIQYSSQLSAQIPKSFAAHSFNVFQDAQFKFEIISLLALWDSSASNSVSIPTVIDLIDDPNVLSELCKEVFQSHANRGVRNLNPSDDPEIQRIIDDMTASHQFDFAKEQSQKAEEILQACVKVVKEVLAKEKMESVRNLRDLVSHSVTATRREARGKIAPMKYGDEKELLTTSIRLIEDLYCWVNGTSFDIQGACVNQARKHANELWSNCKFDIPDR